MKSCLWLSPRLCDTLAIILLAPRSCFYPFLSLESLWTPLGCRVATPQFLAHFHFLASLFPAYSGGRWGTTVIGQSDPPLCFHTLPPHQPPQTFHQGRILIDIPASKMLTRTEGSWTLKITFHQWWSSFYKVITDRMGRDRARGFHYLSIIPGVLHLWGDSSLIRGYLTTSGEFFNRYNCTGWRQGVATHAKRQRSGMPPNFLQHPRLIRHKMPVVSRQEALACLHWVHVGIAYLEEKEMLSLAGQKDAITLEANFHSWILPLLNF